MRLARTSINHSYQTASIQSSTLNPFVEGIEWQSALIHGRTCGLCQERHGTIYPIDEVPLDHPSGLCSMLPTVGKGLDQVAEELKSWLDGEDNPILDNWYDNYGDYFSGLSKAKHGIINIKGYEDKSREKRYNSTKEAFKRVSYTNMDKDYAKEIDAELLDIINKYPLDSKGMTVKALKKDSYFGYQSYGIGHNKKTNKLYISDEIVYSNYLHNNKKVSTKTHEMNYRGRGSPLLNSKKAHLATISHEYGHAIDTYYLLAKDKKLMKDIKDIDGKTLDWGIANSANSINMELATSKNQLSYVLWDKMKKEYGMEDKEFNQKIHDELGSYAASEPVEFLAEGFANMNCLEEGQKTEFIKMFEKIFNEEFDKVLRGGR